MGNKKIIIILSLALVVLLAVFSAVYIISKPDVQKGSKEIAVTVIFADKSKKVYTIKTDNKFLADALLEKGIIKEKSKDGLYTVIDGERADYNLDKSWWCLTKNNETVNVGINDQPIADGEKYEITNTPS